MTTQPPNTPVDRGELPPDVDQEQLERFVRRANAGGFDDADREGLTAAVAVIEIVLDRTAQSVDKPTAVPSATKWANAAGYQDEEIDDG